MNAKIRWVLIDMIKNKQLTDVDAFINDSSINMALRQYVRFNRRLVRDWIYIMSVVSRKTSAEQTPQESSPPPDKSSSSRVV